MDKTASAGKALTRRSPQGSANPSPGRASTVLIVDDDPVSGMILESILKMEGFHTLRAMSGREGRELAMRYMPDMILLDINMPDENGLQTCQALKTNAVTTDIPVIFLSALEEVEAKVEGFRVGGVDYITKPYHPAEVLARVRLHIRLHQGYQMMMATYLAQLDSLAEAQQQLLAQPEELPEARFAAFYLPCQQAGGDFYDVIHTGEKVYDYLVADVSGHDLGTALATAALKALIRQNAALLYTPLENLYAVNRHIRPVLQDGQYATLLYARLNWQRGRLTLINAGNPGAILARASGGVEAISQPGDVIGAFERITVTEMEHEVFSGDRLFLFSDGLIEQAQSGATPRSRGIAHLLDMCAQTRKLPLAETVATIAHSLLPAPAFLQDDVVLLAMEV